MSKKKNRSEEASHPSGTAVNSSASSGWPAWAWKLATALIVVILFWRATGYGYLIPGEGSRLLQDARLVAAVKTWGAAFSSAWEWQPLAWLALMVEFQLFGPKADAQRTLGLLLHIANAILLLSVFRRFTGATALSAAAALLFAVHPLRVEPVVWIAERRMLLVTLFTLCALRAYAEFVEPGSRRALWGGFVLCATALAALCHPAGAVIPLLLLLIDDWPLERKQPLGARLAEKAPLALVSLFTLAMSLRATASPEALWTNGTLEAGVRLWHSACGLGLALFRSVASFSLNPYNALEPPTWAIAIVPVALAAATWARSRPLLMGLVWFTVAMLPTLGLVQPEVAPWSDSGTYLAHVGLVAGFVWFLAAWDREKATAVAGLLGLIWFGLAWLRVGEWESSEKLLRTSVERGAHPLAQYQLGQLLLETRRYAESEAQLKAVAAARPQHVETRLLLANAYLQMKRAPEGVAQLEEVIRLAPQRPDGYYALGFLQSTSGQPAEGARNFAEAMKRGLTIEQEAQAENAIGVWHLNEKRFADAERHLERSWKLVPTYASAHANFAKALDAQGKTRQAFNYMQRALLYTKEAQEVVDIWTVLFNKLSSEEKRKTEQAQAAQKKNSP